MGKKYKLEFIEQLAAAGRLGSPSGGKQSAVAVVNDSPVGCQSRDRVARRRLAKIGFEEPIFD